MATKPKNTTLFAIYMVMLLLAIAITPNLAQLDFIANWQDLESKKTIKFFQFISDSISYFSFGVPTVITVISEFKKESNKKRSRLSLLYVLLSIGVAGLISYIVKKSFTEPRPYEVDARITQLSVGGGYSLPSGHTTEAFASAMALTLLFSRWYVFIPMFVWASVVGLSRVYLGVHYPLDIFVGMLIGSTVSFSFYTFLFGKYLNHSSTIQPD
ncbi:MAG TPA: phosphatase PAP2 family protein [Cyclobacteriaceae bacterium]|jgi:membrane-associated phospholipid phosphatase|nr:phosphatase PAP2 family protein [Cyclobacteriaceae bacterium]